LKTTVWENRNIVIYIGGDPDKNIPPEITLEIVSPQILFDSDKGTIFIKETK
jgi:hypothetical protein